MKTVQTQSDINDDLQNKLPIPEPRTARWTDKYMPTAEQIENFSDPQWIIQNLVIEGHLIAICAEPNGGKTTVMMAMAARMAKTHEVTYVNSDISSTDIKQPWEFAQQHGFTLAMPDLIPSMSMDDVVDDLVKLNNISTDLRGQVFICDTLKKMVDVLNKKAQKRLYITLRGLTAKGATVIVLCHTNKYRDDEGNPIYEGTGDLKSDIDELIYLIPQKHDDESMTVSTKPDKVRGRFQPITFEIDADRNVRIADEFVDTAAQRAESEQLAKDQSVIEVVTEAMQAGKNQQSHIVEYCKEHHVGRPSVEAILRRYVGRLWTVERQFQNNAKCYYLN